MFPTNQHIDVWPIFIKLGAMKYYFWDVLIFQTRQDRIRTKHVSLWFKYFIKNHVEQNG